MSAHLSRHTRLREAAVRRGLRFMARLAAYEPLVPYLGSGLLWFCRSLVTSSSGQLQAEARQLARSSFRCWQRQEGASPDPSDPDSIAEHVRAYSAAEAMGFGDRRMKAQLGRAARAFQAGDFLGFDPRTEAPPLDIPDVCRSEEHTSELQSQR